MTFAHPYVLLWGLLVLAVAVLYRLRSRSRREVVATGMFWDEVFADQQARTRWLPWRDRVSLVVQILMLLLLVIALAEPQWTRPRRIVLIVDNSASMSATDVGPSRLAVAKEAAGRLLDTLADYDQMAILTTGGVPAVVSSPTSDRAALLGLLESVTPTQAPAAMAQTLHLAEQMMNLPGSMQGSIVLVSDGCFADAVLASQSGATLLRVGGQAANVGVTQLAARRTAADAPSLQLLVEVTNFSDRANPCDVKVSLGDRPLGTTPLKLAGNARQQYVFDLADARTGRLVVEVTPTDVYPADNRATVEVPPLAAEQDGAAGAVGQGGAAALPPPVVEASPGGIDLRCREEVGEDAVAFVGQRPRPPLWLIPAGLVMVLLAVEWCLYQRRWMS